MILMNVADAIGYKIKWCRWKEPDRTFLVEEILWGSQKLRGIEYNSSGEFPRTTYNIVGGITTGEILKDYWYIIDYINYGLDDELFEI